MLTTFVTTFVAQRKVEVVDCRLRAIELVCRVGILCYVVLYQCAQNAFGRHRPSLQCSLFCRLCARHQYAEFEPAAAFTNVWPQDDFDPDKAQSRLSPPGYCNNPSYNWAMNFTEAQLNRTGAYRTSNIGCVPFDAERHIVLESASFMVYTSSVPFAAEYPKVAFHYGTLGHLMAFAHASVWHWQRRSTRRTAGSNSSRRRVRSMLYAR